MGLLKETRKKFKVRPPKFSGKNHRPKNRVGTPSEGNQAAAKLHDCEINLAAPEIQVSLLSSTSTDEELCLNITAYDDVVNSSIDESKPLQRNSFTGSQTPPNFSTGPNGGKIDVMLDSGPPSVVLNISAEDIDKSLSSNTISTSVDENSLISGQFYVPTENHPLVTDDSSTGSDYFKAASGTNVCDFLKTESSNCLSEASNILIEEAMEIIEKHIRDDEQQNYYIEPLEECTSSFTSNLTQSDNALPQLDCTGMNLFPDSYTSSETLCESIIKNEPLDTNDYTSSLDVENFSDLIRFNRSSIIPEASLSAENSAFQETNLSTSRINQTWASSMMLEQTIQPQGAEKNQFNFFSGQLPNGVSLLPSSDPSPPLCTKEDNSNFCLRQVTMDANSSLTPCHESVASTDAQYVGPTWNQWDCALQPFPAYDYRRDGADPGGPGWPVNDPWPRKDEDDCGRDPHEAAALQNHVRHLHLHKYYRDEKPPTYDPHSAQHKQPYYSISRELGSFASSSERHYFDPYALAYHGDRSPSQLIAPPPFAADQHGQLSHPSTLLLQHCRMEASDAPAAPGNDGPKIDRRSLDGNPTAGRNSAGGSPMGSPMPAGGAGKTRMDRLCGVCGDRALGYNFNAITCESCKAFFRRNALKNKNLKCPFQDNCSVDTVTRRFCQKCRLRKCFEIGMKKEWIMTEEEKLKKKQKIEANKLRKQAGESSVHPPYGCVEAAGRSSPSHSPSFKTELSPSPASSTASMEHGDQTPEFHFSRGPSAEFEIPGSPEGLKKPHIQSHMIVHEKAPLGSPYFSIPNSTVLHINDTHSKPHAVVIGMVRGTEANGARSNTDNTASKVMRLDNQSDVHHEGMDTGAGAQPSAPLTRHESATSLTHMGGTHSGVELTLHPFQGARSTSVYESAATPAVPVASVTPVPHVTESPQTTASLREAFSQVARTHPQVFSNATSSPPTVMSVQHSPLAPHGNYVCKSSVPSMLSAALNMHAGASRQLPRDFPSSFDPFPASASPTTASQFGPPSHNSLTTSAPHATHRNPSLKPCDYRDTVPLASNGPSISRNVPPIAFNSLDAPSCAAAGSAAASGPGCLGRSQLLRASAKPITRSPETPGQDFSKIGILSPPASSSVSSLCIPAASGPAQVKQEPSWSPGASELKSCDNSSSSSPLHSSISSGRNSSPANSSILKFETGCKQNENSLLKSRLSSPGLLSLPVSPISRTPPNFCASSFVFPSEENFTCNSVPNSESSDSLARRMGASVSTSQESSPQSDDVGSASGHLPSSRQNLPATSEESLISNDSPSASKAFPSASGELPSASLLRPPTSEDFQAAAEKLSSSTDISSACGESTPVTANSRCTSKESISLSNELPSAFEKLSTPKELSIVLEEMPSTSEELLSTPGEFQTALKKLPLPSGELPSASEELPSASKELPSASEELPSASDELPSASEELPSASEELPSASEELPSISEELPAISEEQPSISEEQLSNYKEQSSIYDELSSATLELSSLENLESNSAHLFSISEELRPPPVSLLATNEALPFTPENLPVEELPFTFKEPQTTSNKPLKSYDEISVSDVKPSASSIVKSASDVVTSAPGVTSASDVVTSAPGVTSASDVAASASDVAASASDVAASASDVAASASDVAASASDGAASASDVAASASDVAACASDVGASTSSVVASASGVIQSSDNTPSASDDIKPVSDDVLSARVCVMPVCDSVPSANGMPSSGYDAPLATDATQSASDRTQTEPLASSSTFNATPSLEDAMSFSVLEALKKIQDNDASQNGGILPKGASESSYRDSIVNSAVEAEMSPYTLLLGASQGHGLTAAEKYKLDELQRADYAMLAPLSDDQDYRKDQVNPSLINVINMTDIAIRRLIQMSKQLSSFSSLCVHDQIALLKGSCTEMMILRSVTAYDADKEAWKIPEHRDTYKSIKLKVLKGAPGNVHVYEEHKRFILAFRPEWRHDQNIMLLLSAITLFTPTRPNVQHRMAIQHEQCCYLLLLKRYLETRLGVCESRAVYWDLLERINDLRRLNENHVQVYMQVNPEEVRPLLIEIFDLKQR